jgi:dTDP-4-amino-4,6-dideoxygalactose transaminase
VYADIDPEYGVVGADQVYDLCGSREISAGDVFVAVHNAGVIHPTFVELTETLKEHGVILVEDCSHAHLCSLNGRFAGTFGDYAAWSFYPTKVLLSSEGGIAAFGACKYIDPTPDHHRYAQSIANQGKHRGSGVFGPVGYNLRISELSACLMVAEIENHDLVIGHRRMMLDAYVDAGIPVLQASVDGLFSSCYKYTHLAESPERAAEIKMRLKELGHPATGATYDRMLVEQGDMWVRRDLNPSFMRRHVNLPYSRQLNSDEMMNIAEAVSTALENS